MGFGILRVKKLKRADVPAVITHNYRERKISNADPKKSKDNVYEGEGEGILERLDFLVDEHEKTTGKKIRKDAVQAVEILVTFSHGALEDFEKRRYFRDSRKFIEEQYGKENILSVVTHEDEKTPHQHYLISPILDKKFNANKLIGNKPEMGKLQDKFFETVSDKYRLARGEKNTGRRHVPQPRYRAITDRKKQEITAENQNLKVQLEKFKKGYIAIRDEFRELREQKDRTDEIEGLIARNRELTASDEKKDKEIKAIKKKLVTAKQEGIEEGKELTRKLDQETLEKYKSQIVDLSTQLKNLASLSPQALQKFQERFTKMQAEREKKKDKGIER